MKTLLRLSILLGVLVALGAAAYRPTAKYLADRNRPRWRTATVEHGSIVAVVNSTGTVKPKIEVTVGSFVSGPIQELYCEFNQEVKKGDLLAKIDPQICKAAVAHDQATLAIQEADVFRVESQLLQAIEDEKRAIALRRRGESYISQADFDKFKFNRMSLEAQVKVSKATVDQARASLETSLANLRYTEIRSPVDGIVINRKIEPGQTVAAQFQTPELFIVAPDIRKEIRVHASVDEADIGLIKQAQNKNYPVTFTVDAYPDKMFKGTIQEIRLSSTTTQNVVTYPVVVATSNPDLELLPGMTASLSFQVDERSNVIKVPSAALRFYPTTAQVRAEDLPILEGKEQSKADDDNNEGASLQSLSIAERTRLRKERSKRHVWVADGEGDKLRAIEVKTGLTDGQFTEVAAGPVKPGDVLVIGVQPPPTSSIW
ncbi:MAG TPA: efflux RND transporter periplasmic adaptor subunit [Planctomycetaceae bacterium]|nr:efflux RND transporter periplasmic adaptor subunit [Planctomycetaceae bacterium]